MLQPGQKAHCPRCNFLLTENKPDAANKILAYSTTALVFLVLANQFPFITLSASGLKQSVTLLGSIAVFFSDTYRPLAAAVFASIVGIPALQLLGMVYISLSIRIQRELPGARMFLRWMIQIAPWNMAEIFLIGILVSFIKIVSMADVTLGISFWAYTLFAVGVVLVMSNFDRREMWHLLDFERSPGAGREQT